MVPRSRTLRALICLLVTLSLALGAPAAAGTGHWDGDQHHHHAMMDAGSHDCCEDHERLCDDCGAAGCQCHAVPGGALPSEPLSSTPFKVPGIRANVARALVPTPPDLPERPPRRA